MTDPVPSADRVAALGTVRDLLLALMSPLPAYGGPLVVTSDRFGSRAEVGGLMAEIQVVLTDAIQEPFRRWLAARGLYLFRIPGLSDDDLPAYGIGIGPPSSTATCEKRKD
jgi:hypothetical protein